MGQCMSMAPPRNGEEYKACRDTDSSDCSVEQAADAMECRDRATKLPRKAERLGLRLPPCKSLRLASLQSTCHALNPEAPPDPQVQSILKLCQSVFQCPNALVVLFDDERAFVREAMGTFSHEFSHFPAWAWSMARSSQQVLIVPNVMRERRFAKGKTTKQLGIQFFALAPLVSVNGLRLGTLCCVDSKPREDVDESQALILNSLAERVSRQIEKDMLLQIHEQENVKRDKASAQLKRAVDCVEDCIVLVDVSVPGWHILYMNAAWDKLMGCSRDLVTNTLVKETLQLQSGMGTSSLEPKRSLPQPDHEVAVQQGKEVTIQGAVLMRLDSSSTGSTVTDSTDKTGSQPVNLMLRPAAKGAMRRSAAGVACSKDGHSPRTLQQAEHLYFMALEPVKPQLQSRSLYGTPTSGFLQDQLDPDAGLVWDSSGADSWSSSMKGLELSHLLGSGSFGAVYSGRLYGTHVAVKIINEELHVEEGKSLEAMCGVALKHPHVINVLKVMVRRSGSTNASERNSSTHSFYAKPVTLELEKAGAESTSLAQQEQKQLQVIQENMQWEQEQQQQLMQQQEARANCQRTMAEDLEGFIKEPELACSWPALHDNSLVDEETPQDDLVRSITSTSTQGFNLWNCMASQPCVAPDMIVQSQTWLVMEFCDKGCLLDAVDKGWLHEGLPNGPPNMTAILATAYEVASALMYLHKRGIVHGDLSPVNVLLSTSSPRASEGKRGFVAKVADLGLARALNVNSRITTKTHGTLTHQPPETLAEGIISRATDIYSLGVLMWAMYTGSRPWQGFSHAQIVGTVASKREHLQLPPNMPRAHAPFAELVARCLSYEVSQRPNTEAILDALANMQGMACSAEP